MLDGAAAGALGGGASLPPQAAATPDRIDHHNPTVAIDALRSSHMPEIYHPGTGRKPGGEVLAAGVCRPSQNMFYSTAMASSGRDFPDGVALVTGGSGGLGRAVCEALARAGTTVAVTYRSRRDAADQTAAAVRSHGAAASVHGVELGDAAAVAAMVEQVAAEHGAIHTVIHAAGSDIRLPYISQVSVAAWTEVMRRDADGFFHLVRASLPHLRQSRGALVALTSAGLARYPARDILSVAPKAAI